MKIAKSGAAMIILLLVSIPLFSQNSDILKWRKLYKTGVRSLADQDLIASEQAFQSLIAIPQSGSKALIKYQSKAYYFLGDVYFIRKQYQKALVYYRTVVRDYYDQDIYSKTLYKMGRTLVLNNQFSEGVALLNDYLARYDNRDGLADNTLYWLGRAYLGMKDYTLSLQAFKLILQKYPDTALAYDVRRTLGKLTKVVEDETQKKMTIDSVTNQLFQLKRTNRRLQQEKILLEKASRLLVLKQKLLQMKNSKIEELNRIKANLEEEK